MNTPEGGKPGEWWQSFDEGFGEILFRNEKLRKPSDGETEAEIEQVLRVTGLRKGSVLDLACGVGRHTRRLAERGFDVVGLDFSESYIDECRRSLPEHLGGRASFVRGDMRELRSRFHADSFDLVVCLWNSFGYFADRADDRKVLHEVAHVLKPGGLFVLSTFQKSGIERMACTLPRELGLQEYNRWEFYGPGQLFLQRLGFDPQSSRTDGAYMLVDIRQGTVKHYPHQDNVYSHPELQRMLQEAGLVPQKAWGALYGAALTPESPAQTVLAEKPPLAS